MNDQSPNDYKNKDLDELLKDWEEGKLTDEQKEYVISMMPVLAYLKKKDGLSEKH